MHGFHADAIVVLGSTVHEDGSLPLHARQRAVRAAMLHAAGVAPRVIFSGRCNLTAPEPPAISEAAAMAAYAESLGTPWVFPKILGPDYDVSFSPASTEFDATVIAARARDEGDIITFLMEWIGPIEEGDRAAIERFIHEEHTGYASNPSVSREEIQERVNEIARVHRVVETHGLRGTRARQERDVEL